jgi:hypothetical protein
MIIYLDESGDLGFDWEKSKTSAYFVITVLACNDQDTTEEIKKAVKRTLRNKLNHKKSGSRTIGELKGSGTTFMIKDYFFRQMPSNGWSIYAVTLNKKRIKSHLTTAAGKKKLYNFLARFLIEKIKFPEGIPIVNLVVDRCKNTEEIKDFNAYIQNQLQAYLPLDTSLYINHEASHESTGLQAVDMFCWGIARKNTSFDLEWYNRFKDRIEYETIYLE